MSRKRLSSPRCRSELIDSAWVVIVPGQNALKKTKNGYDTFEGEIYGLMSEPPLNNLNVVRW